MEELLTIEQAAERLNMSPRWVRRLVSERRITFHKLGRAVRIAAPDLVAFVEANKVLPMTRSQIWADLRRAA